MDLARCSSRELVSAAHEAVCREDSQGPAWNAVLEWNPSAFADAEIRDRQSAEGRPQGPLHGLPLLLKDNIDTADATHTSAGSLALADRFATRDSEVAVRLRAAGAVLCGKTNMTELANFMTEGMPNGYSSRGGQVRAWPHGEGDPSGSSTGSAVAVAAGYVDAALGTETCGSIIGPASAAGIVGLRPTVGRVDGRGILPIAPSRDTAGPLCRTVALAALVYSVLADDPGSLSALSVPSPGGLVAGWKVGLADPEEGAPPSLGTMARLAAFLPTQGVSGVPFGPVASDGEALATLLVHEFRPAFDAALREGTSAVRTLSDLAAYNRLHPESCLRHGQSWVDRALGLSRPLLSPDYREARRSLGATAEALYRQMDALDVRLVVAAEMVSSFSFVGAPALTLPGPLFLYARPWDEVALLQMGAFLESEFPREPA